MLAALSLLDDSGAGGGLPLSALPSPSGAAAGSGSHSAAAVAAAAGVDRSLLQQAFRNTPHLGRSGVGSGGSNILRRPSAMFHGAAPPLHLLSPSAAAAAAASEPGSPSAAAGVGVGRPAQSRRPSQFRFGANEQRTSLL